MSERSLLLLIVAAFCAAVGVVVYLVVATSDPAPADAYDGPAAVGGRPPRPRTFKVRKPLRRPAARTSATGEKGATPRETKLAPAGGEPGTGAAGGTGPAPRTRIRTRIPGSGRR
ncbi:MAG: hypothetical protein D6705_13145 [Deltaproteobacteria bacterium]|nr:MAG: hypothetical protein D6705_13145 [Deltaproteobacteria bacterium]